MNTSDLISIISNETLRSLFSEEELKQIYSIIYHETKIYINKSVQETNNIQQNGYEDASSFTLQ